MRHPSLAVLFVSAAALLALGVPVRQAAAGCTVVSLGDATLEVAEPAAGAWQSATDAATEVLDTAKVAGNLFNRVYMGGYMKQQVQRELDANDQAWDAAAAALQQAALPFEGTCAGEILGDVLRKASTYRDPERNMVLNALKGKPIQASQEQVHEGRSLDFRDYERRWVRIRDGADVAAGAAAGGDDAAGPGSEDGADPASTAGPE